MSLPDLFTVFFVSNVCTSRAGSHPSGPAARALHRHGVWNKMERGGVLIWGLLVALGLSFVFFSLLDCLWS